MKPITLKEWEQYYTELWTDKNDSPSSSEENNPEVHVTTLKILKTIRNRKSRVTDVINIKLLKYANQTFLEKNFRVDK